MNLGKASKTILRILNLRNKGFSIREISREVGISKSTVHRLIQFHERNRKSSTSYSKEKVSYPDTNRSLSDSIEGLTQLRLNVEVLPIMETVYNYLVRRGKINPREDSFQGFVNKAALYYAEKKYGIKVDVMAWM